MGDGLDLNDGDGFVRSNGLGLGDGDGFLRSDGFIGSDALALGYMVMLLFDWRALSDQMDLVTARDDDGW